MFVTEPHVRWFLDRLDLDPIIVSAPTFCRSRKGPHGSEETSKENYEKSRAKHQRPLHPGVGEERQKEQYEEGSQEIRQ